MNVERQNRPTYVAGNEYFLVPCPKDILSSHAVISRVDTVLVQDQISLSQGIICFEETIHYYSLAFYNRNLDIKWVKNNENIIYSKHMVKNLFNK